MSKLVQEKTRAHRNLLRKYQIETQFQCQRERLKLDPSKQTQHILRKVLIEIKSSIQFKKSKNLLECFQQFRNIASQHCLGELLLTPIHSSLQAEQETDYIPADCSWAHLFVISARQQTHLEIKIQLIVILSISLYQLRRLINRNHKEFQSYVMDIISSITLQLHHNLELLLAYCKLLGQLLLSVYFLGIEEFLLQNQNISDFILLLGQNKLFLQKPLNRMRYIQIGLLLLLIAKEQNLKAYLCQQLKQDIQSILVNGFQQKIIPFPLNCDYLRRYWLVCHHNLECHFHYIQSMYKFALDRRCPEYFNLLNTIYCFTGRQLTEDLLEDFFSFVFEITTEDMNDEDRMNTLQIKKWMINLLKRYTDNSKEQCYHESEIIYNIFNQSFTLIPSTVQQILSSSQIAYELLIEIIEVMIGSLCKRKTLPQQFHQKVQTLIYSNKVDFYQ